MTNVTLSPEQESFVAQVVGSGRYHDLTAVVGAALDTLKRFEEQRSDLLASVLDAQAEGDRVGYLSGDDVLARVEARLARRSNSAA